MNTRRSLLLLVNLLLVAAMACSLPSILQPAAEGTSQVEESATLAGPSPTPLPPLPPELIETKPATGEKLPPSGGFTLFFDQAMDHASVEAAFSLSPEAPGQLLWQDERSLQFIPNQELQRATDYQLTIGAQARSTQGLSPASAIERTFTTAGYAEVTQVQPAPSASGINPTSRIQVAFNQPMVPLSPDSPQPQPLRFDPAISGQGEWVGTSLYVFTPEPALPAGSTITATVDSGLVAPDGALLSSSFSWTFSTTRPQLLSSSLSNGQSGVALDPEITLTFNMPMSSASLEGAWQLQAAGGQSLSGSFEWTEREDQVTFTPSAELDYDTEYELSFEGATGPSGTPLIGSTSLSFSTVPQPQLVGSDPAPGGTKPVLSSLSLYFSGPMSEASLLQNIELQPQVESFSVSWDPSEYRLYVRGDFAPNRQYTLNLGLAQDAYGTPLDQGASFTFRTDNYPPRLDFTRYHNVLTFSTGEAQELQLQATNVSQIQLRLNRLSLDQFLAAQANLIQYVFNAEPLGQPVRNWTASIIPGPNQNEAVSIPLSESGSLASGLYQVIIDTAQDSEPARARFLLVRGTEIVLKAGGSQLLAWAVDLDSGQPVDSYEANLVNYQTTAGSSSVLGSGGLAEFTVNPKALANRDQIVTIGQPGDPDFGMTSLNWNQGIAPYNFHLPYTQLAEDNVSYVYTDRPLYRPGQTVHFKGVFRQLTEAGYTIPDPGQITITVHSPNGAEIESLGVTTNEFGTFVGSIDLSPEAPLGLYRITTSRDSTYFEVNAYRKPELELTLTPSEQDRIAGEPLTVEIQANYFFGAPAAGQEVDWQVFSSNYSPPDLPTPYAFAIGDYSPEFGLSGALADGRGVTDSQGSLVIEVPTEFETLKPRQLTIEATISEQGSLPVSGRTRVNVHPAAVYVSVVPTQYSLRAGEQADFRLHAVDFLGVPLAGQLSQIEVARLTWQQIVNDEGDIEWQQQERVVNRDQVVTEGNGSVLASFVPQQAGSYEIRASASDSAGREVEAQTRVWVVGPAGNVWRQSDPNRIALVPDKEQYQPGETAQVLVPSPFDVPVLALVTVERETILDRQVITIPAEGLMLDVPIHPTYLPNVYLSAVLIKPPSQAGPASAVAGLLNLPVSAESKHLTVQLSSDQAQARPGDEVTYQVQATDAQGNPAQAEFSLGLVDEALLALKPPNSEDPFEALYSQRSLAVGTALGLVISGESSLRDAGPLGVGGGGGGDYYSGVIRQQFEDTAYWQPDVVTDENGRAEVNVRLPDNLTSWRMEARGVSQDTEVGSAEHSLTVSKPLLIRPVTPRFFTAGDHSLVAAEVHNNTSASFTVEVRLSANGASINSAESTTITLGAGEAQRVEWQLDILEADAVSLTFFAEGGGFQDASTPTIGSARDGAIPVLHYSAPDTEATAGWLAEAGTRTESISLPASFDPTQGQLVVTLEPSLGSVVRRSRTALEEYPYETTRHMAARLMVNSVLLRVRSELEAADGLSLDHVEQEIGELMQSLLGRQNLDGGWGWWPGSNSQPALTAYALDSLLQAQQAGFSPDERAIERATSNLSAGLSAPQGLDSRGLVQQAYILNVLIQADLPYEGTLRSQAVLGDRLPLLAKAFTAQALAALAPSDAQLPSLIASLESAAQLSATGTHWQSDVTELSGYASGVETTAHMVRTLLATSPDSPNLPGAIRWLVLNRDQQGGWRTSANTGWASVALLNWVQSQGSWQADYPYELRLNGEIQAEGEFQESGISNSTQITQAIGELSADSPNALTIGRGQGEGTLSYAAHLTVYRPAEEVEPSSRGLSIERRYYLDNGRCDFDDDPCQPVESAAVGDDLLVRLTITVPSEVYYLAAEDPFGAGLEPIDPGLSTSSGQPLPLNSRYQLDWIGWTFNQVEYGDQKLALFADYLPAGTYTFVYRAHASFAGDYQTLPARVWLMHFPEISGNSAGARFAITP